MSRMIDKDFEKLRAYLSEYSLEQLAENDTTLQLAKQGHKQYLTALQLWAAFIDSNIHSMPVFFNKKISPTSPSYNHFKEAISDIGSSFFCCIHGAYKPSYMALRSSIENFLRFSIGEFNKTALTTTKIYELFDLADKAPEYSIAQKEHFKTLKGIYKQLCEYTHSASLGHMTQLHGLTHFPKFSQRDFKSWNSYMRKIGASYLVLVLSTTPDLYTKAHYIVREIFDLALPRAARLLLLGNKTP